MLLIEMKEHLERFFGDFENIWKLFNHTNDGLIITNGNQEILAANPTFQKITGYTYEELYLKTPSMFQSGEMPHFAFTEMWTAIIEKGTWTGELINKRKNGERYWAHITITEIKKEAVEDRYYIGAIRDITASKLVSEEISYYAFNDPLTDMANRVRFNQVLTEQLKEHEKNKQSLAILFFDLDRFKIINDTFGHLFGDDILKSIATRLKEAIGDRGFLGRFGGDEFTVLLPNINSEKEVTDLISTIFKKFSELPIMCNERSLFVTTSVGVSFFPEHGQDVDTLIKTADTAMYCSKDRGRNNYQIYDEAINQNSYHQLSNGSDPRKALAKNSLKSIIKSK